MTNLFVFFLEFFVFFAEFSMGLVQLKRSLETFTLSSRVSSCLVWRASSLWFNLETSCRWISSWLSWECWCWEWWNWKVDGFGTGFPFSCCQRLTNLFLIHISKLTERCFLQLKIQPWIFNQPQHLVTDHSWCIFQKNRKPWLSSHDTTNEMRSFDFNDWLYSFDFNESRYSL